MKMIGRAARFIAIAGAISVIYAMPAVAADDAEKSLLIGLGVTAATGKTSLGDGSGEIEAGILNQEALQQTGAIIAMVANGVAVDKGGRPVLVLPQAEILDFTLPEILATRFEHIKKNLHYACAVKKKTKRSNTTKMMGAGETEELTGSSAGGSNFWGGAPRAADLFGAAMVDRSISKVTVATVDRQLVAAVLMNGGQPAGAYSAALNSWNAWSNPVPPTAFTAGGPGATGLAAPSAVTYEIWGEPQYADTNSRVWTLFKDLRNEADDCLNRKSAEAWLEVANTALTGAISAEKGASPLSIAAQIDRLGRSPAPLILRLTVDHSGGTAINRTGLLYSLGFPNAATVGAGLVSSFRIFDPTVGKLVRQGVVRCAVDQTNLRDMRKVLDHRRYRPSVAQPRNRGEVVCDFKVA